MHLMLNGAPYPEPIRLSKTEVLAAISCYPDSAVYDEASTLCEVLLSRRDIQPQAAFAFGHLSETYGMYQAETPVIYLLVTAGGAAEAQASAYFAAGDYLTGMLQNAIADHACFAASRLAINAVTAACKAAGWGILRRCEAPKDMPMAIQREILTKTNPCFAVTLTDALLFCPVKTLGAVFIRTREAIYHTEQNCANCGSLSCPYRNTQSAT